ncbi:MAG: hypothetical protein OXF02_03380 [Simkaniaceae bacterium]|nr:hypothetical protein [Simkaniaceae bacterium]
MKRSLFTFGVFLGSLLGSVALRAHTEATIFPVTQEEKACYLVSQEKRRMMDMEPVVRALIRPEYLCNEVVFGDFLGRVSTGTQRTTMIDESRGLYPERGLIRIGSGGNRCVVTYGSFDPVESCREDLHPDWDGRTYAHCIDKMVKSLENKGFNGYLYYRKGGYPQPEGWELGYADVPYAFKVWMLKEARDLGLFSCMWVDSVFVANRSVDPLFDIIEERGGFFIEAPVNAELVGRYIFDETVNLLEDFTGERINNEVAGGLFGLQMDNDLVRAFLKKYDEVAKARRPFYSCSCDQAVFSALCHMPMFSHWRVGAINLPWVIGAEDDVPWATRSSYYFTRLVIDRTQLDHVVKSLNGPVISKRKRNPRARKS